MHPICNVQTYFNHTLIEVVTRLAGGQPPPGETAGVDRPGPGITPLSPPVHRSTPSLMFSQQDGAARPISSACWAAFCMWEGSVIVVARLSAEGGM